MFIGAALCAFLPMAGRRIVAILASAAALALTLMLPDGASATWSIGGFDAGLQVLRVDGMSRVFATIFSLNAVLAFIYAWVVDNRLHHTSALTYVGCALGTVFAGDVWTLYFCWEGMAVASTFVLLSANTDSSRQSAFRYVLVHLLGGLVLLAGLVQYVHGTGQSVFSQFTPDMPGYWLILVGLLINAAAPPMSAWLSDAYPEASFTGGLILSAYTTKTAVYTIMRGFRGEELLIWIGCIMAIYGIVYALLENDMRRILAYSIINQVGFMICGIGIGTDLAINGACAHAFCHILYKSLLWMSAGAVLYRTGKRKCTELGGLYHTMPWTLAFGCIGALAISAVPFTNGFTSKTLILEAIAGEHKVIPWLVLECASAGVFLHAGIKFPYFVFFNGDRGLRPKEAPKPMLWAMGGVAFLCIFLGCYPAPLYSLLPYPVDFEPYSIVKVITQFQMLAWSGLVFFLFLPVLKRTNTIVLDTDWFYRKMLPPVNRGLAVLLNSINKFSWETIRDDVMPLIRTLGTNSPAIIANLVLLPFRNPKTSASDKRSTTTRVRRAIVPTGYTVLIAVVFLLIAHLLGR
jgi:multicomponent Na+:H+ antiporter subunit D